MNQKPETIKQWIMDVQETGKRLTKWEEDFIESLADQFSESQSISDRQEEILDRIRAEKT